MENFEFIVRMRNTFKVIREELGNDFPTQYVSVLLDIAANPESSISEVGKRTNMSSSSISRAVAALSTWSWTKKEGQGLVEKVEDLYESRRKLVRLNQHGTRFVKIMKEAFEEDLNKS